METVISILKFVLSVLPVALAAIIGLKVNLKKEKRQHQLILPIVALIYGIIYLALVDDVAILLLKGVYFLIAKVQFLEFLDKINWAYGIMYLVNTVMILLFFVIKGILLPILKAFNPEKFKITKYITGLFYDYDEDWDTSMFIGGSETSSKISDREAGKNAPHYNLVFADVKKFEQFVADFGEKGFDSKTIRLQTTLTKCHL